MTRIILRLAHLIFALSCFIGNFPASSSSHDVTSAIHSKSKELRRELQETSPPKKHHKKKSSGTGGSGSGGGGSGSGSGSSGGGGSSSGGSSSGGSSSGGSSSGGSSSGGSGGGGSSSVNAANVPSPGGTGHLLIGAGLVVAGAVAASLAYARPKQQMIVSHPLNGVIAKRVSRFEALAGKVSPRLRDDRSNDASQYNFMEDGTMRVV